MLTGFQGQGLVKEAERNRQGRAPNASWLQDFLKGLCLSWDDPSQGPNAANGLLLVTTCQRGTLGCSAWLAIYVAASSLQSPDVERRNTEHTGQNRDRATI